MTKMTGFSSVSSWRGEVRDGDRVRVDGLARPMVLSLIDHDTKAARLRIRMRSQAGTPLLDTTVSVHRDRTFMVAGPKAERGVYIVAVSAYW